MADLGEGQNTTDCMELADDQDIANGVELTEDHAKTIEPDVKEDIGDSIDLAVAGNQVKTAEQEKTAELSDRESSEPLKKKMRLDEPEKNVNHEKLRTRNVPASRAPLFQGTEGVGIVDLQGTINRFHLTGPKAFEMLKCVCVPADVGGTESLDTPYPATRSLGDLHWWKQART